MKSMEIRRAAVLSVTAVALLAFATAASAQRGFGGGPQFGGDDARPNPLGLLMRSDVQSHLRLDLRQKNAITQVIEGAQQKQREQMQQIFRNRPQQQGNAQGLSREERRQQMRDAMAPMFEQMRAQQQKFEGELNEEIKKILSPQQAARLYQLDYQYRGPLALADPNVAQAVKLSPETQQAIAKIVNDYRTATGEARREFFQTMFQNNQNQGQQQPGQGGRRPQFNPQDMQARLAPLQAKLDKMKKEAEDKIIAVLNAQEKANWQAATGEPFTFRKDIETGRPFQGGRAGFGRGGGFGGPGGQGRQGGQGRPGGRRPY
jgi:hypothetical protein